MNWNLTLEPRAYQSEAANWALTRRRAVCCLPTGVGKTLVAVLWLKHLFETSEAQKALILEPTRLLVNQTTEYFLQKAGVECIPIDGRIPKGRREDLWHSANLIVATPETTLNDIGNVMVDAVVVDECHHTVGHDAFANVMAILRAEYRLGLSAFVPERREQEVIELIGPVKRWSWSDPDIVPYVPNWIGEVYEANLDSHEQDLLKRIRELPTYPGLNLALLERYLSRDGGVAVRETLSKKNRLAQEFGEVLLPMVPDRMHKLDAVKDIFNTHEPQKAIVFVDRVLIADKVSELFPEMNPVVFKGKKGKFNQVTALHKSKGQEAHLIVSTSAGEEGIDLPLADLVAIWGNAASDIRFVQRLGRIMRKAGEGLKFATFVVTPESSDFDSFALGLEKAAEAGTIDVEKTFGWDPEVLWPRTTWWHLSQLLRGDPKPLGEMAQALEVRDELAEKIVTSAVRKGRLFYIYDVEKVTEHATAEVDKWGDRFRRAAWNLLTSTMGRMRQYRLYALSDDVQALRQKHSLQFSTCDSPMLLQGRYSQSLEKKKGWSSYTLLRGLWTAISPARDLSQAAAILAGRADVGAIALSRKKSERLEYFFRPRNEEVLKAVVENAARFFELIDLYWKPESRVVL